MKNFPLIFLILLCITAFFSGCTIKFEAEKLKLDAEPPLSALPSAAQESITYNLAKVGPFDLPNQ
ncbi:hypothetical protein KAR91_72350 [Candidatus Pacearchaeota archaeon]|nr:hypothetical protein [Candidatus Pacearchaeota archaeon]